MSVLWASAAASGVLAGMFLVVALVARRPFSAIALVACMLACLCAAWSSAALAAGYGALTAAAAAMAFAAACCFAGYRVAASIVLDVASRPPAERTSVPPDAGRLAVLLAEAEPHAYDPHLLASRLRRIEQTGAATLSPGVLPLVFLAERMRYRALRGPHPARYVVEAVADGVRERLGRLEPGTDVVVAYVDSSPSLASVIAGAGSAAAVVVDLGASGSLPYLEARLAAERVADPDADLRVSAPAIWRDVRLASRLTDRILSRVPADARASTGVVLLGAGVPPPWHEQSVAWLEDETYFLTRVAVLLEEAGLTSQAIRHAWMDWQSPLLPEALRHVAAIGSDRIVICPATTLYPDLVTLLDTSRDVRDARLPEHIEVTVLPPWGDDEVLIDVIASRIAEAFGLEPIAV